MIFLHAGEDTMFLCLTEQDCSDMRGGRTKFVDKTATKGALFSRVILSLHKNMSEIEDMIKKAGHGKSLQGMASPTPEPEDGICQGCKGIMKEYMLLDGKCVSCWRELALSRKDSQ